MYYYFFQFRFFIISTFSVSLLAWVVHDIVLEFVEHKAKNPLPAEQAAVLMKYVLMAKWAMRMLDNFFAKVPDDLEMTHRLPPFIFFPFYLAHIIARTINIAFIDTSVSFNSPRRKEWRWWKQA